MPTRLIEKGNFQFFQFQLCTLFVRDMIKCGLCWHCSLRELAGPLEVLQAVGFVLPLIMSIIQSDICFIHLLFSNYNSVFVVSFFIIDCQLCEIFICLKTDSIVFGVFRELHRLLQEVGPSQFFFIQSGCVDVADRENIYTLCPFHEVTQQISSTGHTVLLG